MKIGNLNHLNISFKRLSEAVIEQKSQQIDEQLAQTSAKLKQDEFHAHYGPYKDRLAQRRRDLSRRSKGILLKPNKHAHRVELDKQKIRNLQLLKLVLNPEATYRETEVMVALGASLYARDDEGNTPLHLVQSKEAARALLDLAENKGSLIFNAPFIEDLLAQKNNNDETPLETSAFKGYIAKRLEIYKEEIARRQEEIRRQGEIERQRENERRYNETHYKPPTTRTAWGYENGRTIWKDIPMLVGDD